MGLFGKKRKDMPPPCCGRTPETTVRVGADKTVASVKVLGFGCAKRNALEAAVHTALAELRVSAAIEHVTDFMQIAAYGTMTTSALVVESRVASRGRVPGQTEPREVLREVLEKETLEQGPAVWHTGPSITIGRKLGRMGLSPNQIPRLTPNKVDYLIPGDETINEFLGEGPEARVCPQIWIASLMISASQPGTTTGLSRVAGTDVFLRGYLTKNPATWLGEAHAAHWGINLGFLLKLLHSRDRLPSQTHPDGARAWKYFGLPSGKDEAWYVLDIRPGAYIWPGFRPGAMSACFRELIERQDTATLLDYLHQVLICPEEVHFVPAGTAHAMGSDSLVAKLQEPVDTTLQVGYTHPDSFRLPMESIYGPASMDGLLDCFHLDYLPREELLARHQFRPAPGAEEPWRKRLITPEQTPRFYMDEVELRRETHRSTLCVSHGLQVLLVLEGEAEFQWEGGSLRVRRGEELFVPHGVAFYQCTAEGTCRLLECGLSGA